MYLHTQAHTIYQSRTQASVCSLVLAAPPYALPPSGFVWLQVPAIHRWQWHPFEFAAVRIPGRQLSPAAAAGDAKDGVTPGGDDVTAESAMLIHVKAYDGWTARLVSLVRERGAELAVRAEGPYPEAPHWAAAAGDDAILIVAGVWGPHAFLLCFGTSLQQFGCDL